MSVVLQWNLTYILFKKKKKIFIEYIKLYTVTSNFIAPIIVRFSSYYLKSTINFREILGSMHFSVLKYK